MDGNTVSVERVIKAPADKIFALLADAGKHASFDGSESVNHASQASVPLSMGAKFGMAMRGRKETLFIPYRTTNTVIEYEPDRRIAWKTTFAGRSASVAASGATNSSPPQETRPARWCAKRGTCRRTNRSG